jgi:hypothetical protein
MNAHGESQHLIAGIQECACLAALLSQFPSLAAHLLLLCIEAHSLRNVLAALVAPDVEGHLKPARSAGGIHTAANVWAGCGSCVSFAGPKPLIQPTSVSLQLLCWAEL